MSGPRRVLVRLAAVCAALLLGTGAAAAQTAQSTVAMDANATIVEVAPVLQTTRALQFGAVVAGQTVVVRAPPATASAGTWPAGFRFTRIRKNRTYQLTFQLPTTLTRGTAAVPVDWAGAEFGQVCLWDIVATTCDIGEIPFDPDRHNQLTGGQPLSFTVERGIPGNNYQMDVFLGATLRVPNPPPASGTYTGTIVVTLTVIA